jgi:hypothetical protein
MRRAQWMAVKRRFEGAHVLSNGREYVTFQAQSRGAAGREMEVTRWYASRQSPHLDAMKEHFYADTERARELWRQLRGEGWKRTA